MPASHHAIAAADQHDVRKEDGPIQSSRKISYRYLRSRIICGTVATQKDTSHPAKSPHTELWAKPSGGIAHTTKFSFVVEPRESTLLTRATVPLANDPSNKLVRKDFSPPKTRCRKIPESNEFHEESEICAKWRVETRLYGHGRLGRAKSAENYEVTTFVPVQYPHQSKQGNSLPCLPQENRSSEGVLGLSL